MSEYVSKEELKEFFESIEITVAGRTRAEAISEVLQAIYNGVMELPTTDAEPVIRCKDCKHFDGYSCHNKKWGDGWGSYPAPNKSEDGFCDWAERKE